jgi:probable HAF family extracellular repeat protein
MPARIGLLHLAYIMCICVPCCTTTGRYLNVSAVKYSITDLGTLGGDMSIAKAINNVGDVVGYAKNQTGALHACVWVHGRVTDLGIYGRALGINNSQAVVGDERTNQSHVGHAFKWTHGILTDLTPLDNHDSMATCINDTGTIVGTYSQGEGLPIGCYWNSGGMHKIVAAGERSNICAISRHGHIVGTVARNMHHVLGVAFIWRSGRLSILPAPALAQCSAATAINDRDIVVGYIESRQGNQPYVWHIGKSITYWRLSSSIGEANAINDSGVIIGETNIYGAGSRAAMWLNGQQIDLNAAISASKHWTLVRATGINDKGQIVGQGIHDGHERGFMLTPAN